MTIDKDISDKLQAIADSAKNGESVTLNSKIAIDVDKISQTGTPKNSPKNDWRLGAPRKILDQMGSWYILVLNIAEQRRFNGLPDEESGIIVLDANVTSNAENKVDGYEMVFEVIHAPDHDLILTEGQNNFIKAPPVAKVGDIVLAKGHVNKIHTEPVVYAARRDNFVALIQKAEDREGYVA